MCVGFLYFFLWRGSCVFFLSSCWVWGRLLLSLFWCDCSAFFLGLLRFSAPSCLRLADLLLRWPFSVGLAVSWYTSWFSALCQRSSPFRCFPIGVLHPWRVRQPFWLQFAGLLLRWCLVVGLEGYLLRHLVFSYVPCSSSGPAACVAFPAAGYLGVFRSPGVCPSASLVTLVGLQPFPSFSVLLLLRWLARVGWVLHPVSGCSSCGGVCLGWRCGHPAALTLGWVCFWPTISGVCGLRRRSRLPFVVRHPFPVSVVLHLFWGWGGLVTGLWPLLRLRGFGLFWCSVAPSWRLSLWPHPLLLSPWISSLGVCSDLG